VGVGCACDAMRALAWCDKDETDQRMDQVFAAFTKEEHELLQRVMIYANKLTRIPPAVLDLENLTQLSLNANPLRKLPKEIARLKKLKKLFVEECELTKLPRSLNELTRLKGLFFNGNDIGTIPPLTKVREFDPFCCSFLTL
jgi:Leucine-rich repeat (LRR) protein